MKTVPITLDKERVLKYGVRSFVEIEKELDVPMEKINFERQETIYVLLYAGLIHADRKLTLDKIYNIVDKMIEKKSEEENIPFMEAFGSVLGYIGDKVGLALGNNESDEKPNEE